MTQFDGKMKAITFSYDDATTQDERLVALFNKYGMKCTFNLNSELLGLDGELIRSSELIVFALYPTVFVKWIEENQHLFAPNTVITDVTGVKGGMLSALSAVICFLFGTEWVSFRMIS